MNVKKVIHICRMKTDMTQHDLEKLTGIHRNTISSWERGLYEPKVRDFIKVLNAMGYDLKVVHLEERK